MEKPESRLELADNLPTAEEAREEAAGGSELEVNQAQLDEITKLIKEGISKGWIAYKGLINKSVKELLEKKGYRVSEPQIDRNDIEMPAYTHVSWR